MNLNFQYPKKRQKRDSDFSQRDSDGGSKIYDLVFVKF